MNLTDWNFSRKIMSADHVKHVQIRRQSIKRSHSLSSLLMTPVGKFDNHDEIRILPNPSPHNTTLSRMNHKYLDPKWRNQKTKHFPLIVLGQNCRVYLDPNALDTKECFSKPSPLEQLQKSCDKFFKQLSPLTYHAILNDTELADNLETGISTVEQFKQPKLELVDDTDSMLTKRAKRQETQLKFGRNYQTDKDDSFSITDQDFSGSIKSKAVRKSSNQSSHLGSTNTSTSSSVSSPREVVPATVPATAAAAVVVAPPPPLPPTLSSPSSSNQNPTLINPFGHSILTCRCSCCIRIRLVAALLSSWTSILPYSPQFLVPQDQSTINQPFDLRIQNPSNSSNQQVEHKFNHCEVQNLGLVPPPPPPQQQQRQQPLVNSSSSFQIQPTNPNSTNPLLSWSSLITLLGLTNLSLPHQP